jgi:hypothetical protein
MPAETCRKCNRTIVLTMIRGELVATEREVIEVVPLTRDVQRNDSPEGRWLPRAPTQARQLHAALCDGYREEARTKKIAAEQRAYNRKHRSHGL